MVSAHFAANIASNLGEKERRLRGVGLGVSESLGKERINKLMLTLLALEPLFLK